MLTDSSDITPGAVLESDACIIGGGAAGIAIATRLAGTSLNVALLESGGLRPEPEIQSLNEGENVGLPYFELDETRHRVLGGSSQAWAGWCRRLDSLDFERRSWVSDSGWPFGIEEIEPYYQEAEVLCQIAPDAYEPERYGDAVPPLYRSPFVASPVRTVVWQGSPPTRFGVVYRAELERARNVTVYLHSTVVELEIDPAGGRVAAAVVVGADGRRFRVRARHYVLTAGAIETARLLLMSNSVLPTGLGNEHDLVGRFFTEHPHVVTGRLQLQAHAPQVRPPVRAVDRGLTGAAARLALQRPASGIRCGYALDPDEQERLGTLNCTAHLAIGFAENLGENRAYRSLRLIGANLRSPGRIARQIIRGGLPTGSWQHLRNVAGDLPAAARAVYGEILQRPDSLAIYAQAEQAPNRASRVTLGEQRDRNGSPKVRLDWRLSDLDKSSLRRTQEVLGANFASAGLGGVVPGEWLVAADDSWSPSLTGGHHQLGTARMHADPRRGVVDAAGKVHSLANLFVADGSVFPTVGSANPLLTIVALALRCADHVSRLMARDGR